MSRRDAREIAFKLVFEYAFNKNAVNAHEVNPIYIKKLDVEKW